MYIHPLHAAPEPESLYALMQAKPLGAWVCQGRQGLIANHLPFLLDRSRGPLGSLIGHVARANPVWRDLSQASPSVVMFQGPQAYVTPSWYPSKAEHGQVVPTWDYVVAHVHGMARAIEDRAWLLAMLNALTDAHEARRSPPWRVADAPAAYIDQMLRAIVGIEIPIDRLEGKFKLSQDEALPDRAGTVQGLRRGETAEAAALADWVQQAITVQAKRPA